MHLHRWTSWQAKYDGDLDTFLQRFEELLRRHGRAGGQITVQDVDERHCTKCGKRQQREVKP